MIVPTSARDEIDAIRLRCWHSQTSFLDAMWKLREPIAPVSKSSWPISEAVSLSNVAPIRAKGAR